jgi:predicted DNA-binding transcriptional regulator AlpA
VRIRDARRADAFLFPIAPSFKERLIEMKNIPDTESSAKRPHGAQVHAARQRVAASLPALRNMQLLSRAEVIAITGVSYPSLWDWMRRGKFPRSREVGGRAMWLATEIDAWIAALPVKALKPPEVA